MSGWLYLAWNDDSGFNLAAIFKANIKLKDQCLYLFIVFVGDSFNRAGFSNGNKLALVLQLNIGFKNGGRAIFLVYILNCLLKQIISQPYGWITWFLQVSEKVIMYHWECIYS